LTQNSARGKIYLGVRKEVFCNLTFWDKEGFMKLEIPEKNSLQRRRAIPKGGGISYIPPKNPEKDKGNWVETNDYRGAVMRARGDDTS